MYYVKAFTDSTDTGRTPSTNATSTAPTSSLSSTSLSQNTQQILSSWHRFKRRRDLLERRPTVPGIRHQAYGATPLAASRSADLKTRLWFFEGEACRLWDFPSGRCPMDDGDLFGSRDACARKCSASDKFVPLCQTPPSGVCAARKLRFPFFAVKLPGEKKMRCLNTSALSLHKHLCLTGTNRFPTSAACKRACGSENRPKHRE
ncbi:hypothetical protein V5799_029035 [Amblyomma americanum]|uniref:Uncharacterized protein n=1 Tax=Amblyomma americanum TaxID=6943 RepID=A0AAQ4ESE1_AMBAM